MATWIEPRSYSERRILMMDLTAGDKIEAIRYCRFIEMKKEMEEKIEKELKKLKLTPALKKRINRLIKNPFGRKRGKRSK